jgi:peptide/nickel transport system permease protein
LEIRLQKPFSRLTFLEVRKQQDIQKKNFFAKMLYGQPSFFTAVPISKYWFSADSVYVELFNESPPYNRASYSLAAIGKIHQKTYYLGTDRYGRDVLSQLIIGARVSLSVGFVSVFIALIIGVFLGAIGGYFRGKIDDAIMWFINVVWSIPTLLLVIAISFALGAGFWQIFVAIGLTMWVDIARVVRGQVISLREKEFVEASKALGFKSLTIIFKHILPNITGTIIVVAAANFASAILTEASLSFLGIGVQPPMPSWGTMIKENYGYIILPDYAYLAIIPGIAIMLLVLCFMLLGNIIRDILDVKENNEK